MGRLLSLRRDASQARHTYGSLWRSWEERYPSCLAFLISPPAPAVEQPLLLLRPPLCPYKLSHCMCSAENGCVLRAHTHVLSCPHMVMSYCLTNTSRQTSFTQRKILVVICFHFLQIIYSDSPILPSTLSFSFTTTCS